MLAIAAALPAMVLGAAPAVADSVSNMALTPSEGNYIAAVWAQAQGFTTGNNSLGYSLQSVTLKLKRGGSRQAPTPNIELRADQNGNPAGSALAVLSTSTAFITESWVDYSYTCSTNCSLSADTTYHIRLINKQTGSDPHIHWAENSSGDETNDPVNAGWSIADVTQYRNTSNTYGGNWTNESPSVAKLMKVTYNKKIPASTVAPNRSPAFPENAATNQKVREDEPFTYTVPVATDPDGDTLTHDAALVDSSSDLPNWLSVTLDDKGITFTGTPREADTPANLNIQVTASDDKDGNASVTFALTVEEVNDLPKFAKEAENQTATEDRPFRYQAPIAIDPDRGEADLVYTAFLETDSGEQVSTQQPGWPGWLKFDGTTRTFSGTPGRDDARNTHTILVKVEDPEGLSDTTTFRLRVATLYNSRLPQVARQWLARFGRAVSSQVVDSITGRLSNSDGGNAVVLNGHRLDFSGAAAEPRDASDSVNGFNGGNPRVADPLARLLPSTREQLNEKPVFTSPTSRELLTGSSFRLALSPGSKTMSGAAGHWTLWGEAALTNFDGKDGDLSLDGEVFTGLAAADWQQDQWLLGLAVSRSQGNGSFSAPETDVDDAVKGTVKSSLTTAHPYMRYRPSPGLEVWGVAGYGRGTMTLAADEEGTANPDIWLTTIGLGGRGSLLTADQTGGLALDLTADALVARTGADAAGSLRDAVDVATTRLRLGLEGSWDVQGVEGTAVVPTLTAALRYDTGDAGTGFGVEVGSGLTYTSPGSGISLSAEIRGLLSRQEEEGGVAFREWGTRGSIRYDRGDDDLGLTVAVSPSWGVAGSRADQVWSEAALPWATAGISTSNSAVRLDGEVGYGFAAFNGNGTITPYGGLGLADGSRLWRIGARFSFSPGLDLRIEGSRHEQQRAAPDHGIRLNLNTAW